MEMFPNTYRNAAYPTRDKVIPHKWFLALCDVMPAIRAQRRVDMMYAVMIGTASTQTGQNNALKKLITAQEKAANGQFED